MSTLFKDRQNVVSFGARRGERTSIDAERQELEELRRELERERAALAEQRMHLEQERTRLAEEARKLDQARADFEDDIGVLEEQRHFLDAQREKVRLEAAALETGREAAGRTHALASQRQRVEGALEDARRSREAERTRLQAEMAGLLQQSR